MNTDVRPADIELFRRIAAGDADALTELYQRYHLDIFRFTLSRVHDQAAAEEILQDVFLAAWQRAASFRATASVKTWLLRVAYYRAASWIAARRVQMNIDQVSELPGDAFQAETQPDAAWENELLLQALSELTDKHRTALELVFLHDLTYREAARVVGCPVGTMKSRVNHALSQINRLLVKAGMDGL